MVRDAFISAFVSSLLTSSIFAPPEYFSAGRADEHRGQRRKLESQMPLWH